MKQKHLTPAQRAAVVETKEDCLLDGMTWSAMLKHVAAKHGISQARAKAIALDEDKPIKRVTVVLAAPVVPAAPWKLDLIDTPWKSHHGVWPGPDGKVKMRSAEERKRVLAMAERFVAVLVAEGKVDIDNPTQLKEATRQAVLLSTEAYRAAIDHIFC